jgi:hypothetical protein
MGLLTDHMMDFYLFNMVTSPPNTGISLEAHIVQYIVWKFKNLTLIRMVQA